jgi:branched-chain amino acid transport system substrate-binding protein
MSAWRKIAGALLSGAVLAVYGGAAGAADCPIKIGALAPLSAPGAVTGGEAMRDAMNIAVGDINAAGGLLGCKVELVIGDSQGSPEPAKAVAEKLINQDHVVAIAGEYHSSAGLAAKEVAQQNHIPIVFAETWNDKITADMQDYVFRIAPLSSEASAVVYRFAATVPGVKKVVVAAENTDYGLPASQDTKAALDAAKVQSAVFTVDMGTQDFSGIIQRIKAEHPDMIISIMTGEAAYNFTEQAAEAGIGPGNLPFVCDQVALESSAYWKNVPDGNLCFVSRVGLPAKLYGERTKAFVKAYSEKTGKSTAESYALEAYDSLGIVAQAIADAKSTKGDDIVKALESIKYSGVLGAITFPVNRMHRPDAAQLAPKWWHQFPDPAITMVQYQTKGQDSNDAVVVFPDRFKTGSPIYPKK